MLLLRGQIERLLDDLHTQLVSNISNTVTDVWNLGNRKADELVTGYIKDMAISTTLREKLFSRNADALNTLLKRKDEFGKTISSRVMGHNGWGHGQSGYYLSSGLSSGRPSALISQDIRQLLNEPNRSFPTGKGCEWEAGSIPANERLSSRTGCLSFVLQKRPTFSSNGDQ